MRKVRLNRDIADTNQHKIEAAIAVGLREVERVTVCPYCGDEARGRSGCCGESSAHFEEQWRFVESGEDAVKEAVQAWECFIDALPSPFIEEDL